MMINALCAVFILALLVVVFVPTERYALAAAVILVGWLVSRIVTKEEFN